MTRQAAVFVLLTIFSFAAASPSYAQTHKRRKKHSHHARHTRRGAPKKAAAPVSPFDKYKTAKPSGAELFQDPSVNAPLKILLKKDYRKLADNMPSLDASAPLVNEKGSLVARGGVPHLEALQSGMFIIEPNGRASAAIQDGGEKILYYSSDPALADHLPDDVAIWRAKFPKAVVVFKSK